MPGNTWTHWNNKSESDGEERPRSARPRSTFQVPRSTFHGRKREPLIRAASAPLGRVSGLTFHERREEPHCRAPAARSCSGQSMSGFPIRPHVERGTWNVEPAGRRPAARGLLQPNVAKLTPSNPHGKVVLFSGIDLTGGIFDFLAVYGHRTLANQTPYLRLG